jgi:outer membrane receptor protein involved in Fe transport
LQVDYSWRDDLVGEDASLSKLDYGLVGLDSYEIFNARLSVADRDGSWTVALMGKNLGDDEYWGSTSTDDLGSYPSVPARPRHWMIEATYRW